MHGGGSGIGFLILVILVGLGGLGDVKIDLDDLSP